ncbi:MAG: LLM class F420-dependent oxidoreductase [Acidimicrobiia bacterium]
MQIATMLEYAGGFEAQVDRIVELEKAGLGHVWVAEAYGFDAVSLLGFVAARTKTVNIGSGILPVFTRTPTLLAMTAAGLDVLSHGRFHLGLGASGPQVIEGFHGVTYDAPLGRTREVISICRKVWAREEPLTHDGRYYHVPLPEGQGSGLGKPLKIIAKPERPEIPVWVAALGDKNVQMAVETANGWLPLFFVPTKAKETWGDTIKAGMAKRDAALGSLQISAGGLLAIGEGDDYRNVRHEARANWALYMGGMGARGKNFYNDLLKRYGYEREAEQIQDLFLTGKRAEAAALVPDELLDATNLCGPIGLIKERIAMYKEAGVTHLQVTPKPVGDQTATDLIATLADLL